MAAGALVRLQQVQTDIHPSASCPRRETLSILYGNIAEWGPQAQRFLANCPCSAACFAGTHATAQLLHEELDVDFDKDGRNVSGKHFHWQGRPLGGRIDTR